MDSAAALWWARERYRVVTLAFRVPGTPARERRAELPFLTNHVAGKPDGYLPQRNLVYYAVAGSLAEQVGASVIVAGHLATDGQDFPDARPGYFRRIGKMTGIAVVLPFIGKTKRDVIRYGLRRGVPFDKTWSCYRDGRTPCRECVSCRERSEALGERGGKREER